ncbi:hypothetical protein BDV93DRAFT_562595 [Ceratobasidium sp. AG-I]|nr:hypothetical protein BDV93DRAFT_562595 [Ceratobasidium sp. AG-I]
MPSINSPNCCLHWRYQQGYPPPPGGNLWAGFPFDNVRFQELAGIDPEQGLSVPPIGDVGKGLSAKVRAAWPNWAEGAEQFLRHCDEQFRMLEKIPAFDNFEKTVLRTAPGYEDWAWVILNTFGAPTGLYTQLDTLMIDAGCSGASAYRDARDRLIHQKAIKNQPFREADVKVGAYDEVWSHGHKSLMRQVFGKAVFLPSGHVNSDYVGTLRAISFRRFEVKRASLQRRAKGMAEKEQRLSAALDAAEANPTAAALRSVSRLYAAILAAQRDIGIEGDAETTGTWRPRVEALLETMGRKWVNGKIKIPRSNKRGMSLTDGEMDSIWQEYRDYIFSPTRDVVVLEDAAPEDESGPLKTFDPHLFEKDAGVQEFVGYSEAELIKGMGLQAGLPGRAEDENGKPMIEPSWHQWVSAVAAIVNAFRGMPTLNADEVGLGKTIGVITVIQMLWHLIVLQQAPSWPNTEDDEQGFKWPKLLGNSKQYMGLDKIPLAPTLVICPTSLTIQWKREFEKTIDGKACRILVYRGNEQERDAFFAEDSEFAKAVSGDHPEHTIVIAEAPSVIMEGRRLLRMEGKPALGDTMVGDPEALKNSIFGQRFLLGVLDEAHIYRNVGKNCHIMTTLLAQCTQRMLLTATPVFTHPRNLLSLGRLMRAPGFVGAAGEELTKKFEKSVKQEMKLWKDQPEHPELHAFLRTMYDQSGKSGSRMTARPPTDKAVLETEVNSYKSFWTSRLAMEFVRKALKKMLIRRDNRSRDLNNEPLTSLQDKYVSMSWIKLDDSTRDMLEAQTASPEARMDGRMDLEGFFTRLKKILVHTLLERERPDEDVDLSDDQWMRKCMDSVKAYLDDPSPKINRLLELIKHHRGEENADAPVLYWNRNGERIDGPQPETPSSPTKSKKSRRRKFVVYCHLSQSWKLVAHVLKLHGIETVQVNGSMEAAARDEAVRRFQSEDGPDVILLSNAGSQGLNLQRGSVVIFVDHPWSASETQQVEGRVQRRGQTRDVIVYRIVAPDTPDEFLQGYATGKLLMMQVFTQECETRGMPGFDDDLADDDNDEGDEDDDGPPKKRKPSKLDSRKNKPKASPAPDAAEVDQNAESSAAAASASKTSGKRKADDPDGPHPAPTAPTGPKARASRKKVPHPLFPDLGVRPRAGSKDAARWDRDIANALEEKRLKDVAAADERAAQEKRLKALGENSTPSEESTEQVQDKGKGKKPDKGKGKGKVTATSNESASPQLDSEPTQMQTNLLQRISSGLVTLHDAQSALAAMGEPSIPADVLIANGLGHLATSGSGASRPANDPAPRQPATPDSSAPSSPRPEVTAPAAIPAPVDPSPGPRSPSRPPSPARSGSGLG